MGSIQQIIGVVSCGFLLCLGLSNVALANDPASAIHPTSVGPCESRDGQTALKADREQGTGVRMIQGEVLRVTGNTYFVKGQDGKEVSLQTDQNTEKPDINEGDHIEANLNDQNYALWIRSSKSTDRRNEHAAADCTPN